MIDYALERRDSRTFKYLLDETDIDPGIGLLNRVVKNECLELTDYLIRKGYVPNRRTLENAAKNGWFGLVKFCVDIGIEKTYMAFINAFKGKENPRMLTFLIELNFPTPNYSFAPSWFVGESSNKGSHYLIHETDLNYYGYNDEFFWDPYAMTWSEAHPKSVEDTICPSLCRFRRGNVGDVLSFKFEFRFK
jgi:hypothetical protein